MLQLAIGIFLVLHGLVYLLYVGQSARLFELRSDMAWPDDSWTFARLIGNDSTRTLASITYTATAIGFVTGGVGVLLSQSWWQPVVVAVSAFSIGITILFWDGDLKDLDDEGGFGLLISAAILVSLLVLEWPQFNF